MMRRQQANTARNREQGMTLAISMLIIVALIGMGLTGVWMSSANMSGGRNLTGRQAALNAAQAGLQHARSVLAATATANMGSANPWSPLLTGHTGQTSDQIPTATNLGTNPKGAVVYESTTPLKDYRFPNDPNATQIGSYTIWIRNDYRDLKQGNYLTDNDNIVMVRVLGKDITGTSQVVLEGGLNLCNIAGSFSLDNFVFAKGIDPYGSNSTTGSVRF